MKKLILYLSLLLPFVVNAQAPVSPVIRNTFQNYYEPSTHNNWVWNGSGIWWQAVDSVQLQRNLSKYQPLIPYVTVPSTRTITVAGVTQDLSQNRTYTLANLSNGIGIAGGTYNGSTARVLTVDTAVIGSKAWANVRFAPITASANYINQGTTAVNQSFNLGTGTGKWQNGSLTTVILPTGVSITKTNNSNGLIIQDLGNDNYLLGATDVLGLQNGSGIIHARLFKDKLQFGNTTGNLFQIKPPSSISGTYTATFQNATGTVAYLGDLNSYVPYTGATTNVNLGTNTLTASNLRATAVTTGASGDSLLVKKADNLIYKRPYADFLTPAQAAAIYAVINGGNTFTGDQVVNKTSGVNYYSVQAGTLGNFTGGNAAGYTGRAVSDAGGYYNPFIIQQYQAGTSAVFEINAGSNSGNYPMLFKAGSFNLGTIGNNVWNDNDLNRQKGLLNVFSTDGISAGQTDIFAGDLFAMPVGTQIRYCATSTTNAPTTAAGWVEQYYRDTNIRGLRYRDILGNVWINTTTAYPTWGSWIQVSTSSGSGVYALQSFNINTLYGVNGGGNLSGSALNLSADTTSAGGLVSKSNLSNALALYPRATRNITTGYGINGGGNLTADRTLVADTTSATGLVSKGRLAANLTGYFKLNAANSVTGITTFDASTRYLTTRSNRFFNTSDITTNTEYVDLGWNSNQFQIQSTSTGTGTTRDMVFNSGASMLTFSSAGINGTAAQFRRNNSAISIVAGVASLGLTSSSAVQNGFAIYPTINQTGTGGYRGLWIPIYEKATGSGIKRLISAGTTTADDAGGTYTEKFSVDNAGNTNIFGSLITNSVSTTANLTSAALGDIASTTDAGRIFGAAGTVNYRTSLGAGSVTSSSLTAGANYANVIIGSAPITTGATGTNSIIANLVVNKLGTVTTGGSVASQSASLYVDGQSAATGDNYAILAKGLVRASFGFQADNIGSSTNLTKGDGTGIIVPAVKNVDYIPGSALKSTASGTGAATTITVAHGLTGVTSGSSVVVTANNAAAANIAYATVDATNVSIVYTTAPASGTNNLSYSIYIKP